MGGDKGRLCLLICSPRARQTGWYWVRTRPARSVSTPITALVLHGGKRVDRGEQRLRPPTPLLYVK